MMPSDKPFDPSNPDNYKEVHNAANFWPNANPEKKNYTASNINESFWRDLKEVDALRWYKEGMMKGDLISTKGADNFLTGIVGLVSYILKEHSRKQNKNQSQKSIQMMQALELICAAVVDECELSDKTKPLTSEEVLAFFQGFIDNKYNKAVEFHT